jgi:predicted ATPase
MTGADKDSRSREGATRLFGRAREVTSLGRVLDRLVAGHGGVVLIEGSGGSGKSALLDWARRNAEGRQIQVLSAAAAAGLETVPFVPLLDAFVSADAARHDIARRRERSGAPDHEFWLLQDMQDVLRSLANRAPVLICLDDLHWADRATLSAVRVLTHRLADAPICWLLTARPGHRHASLADLIALLTAGGAEHLSLTPCRRRTSPTSPTMCWARRFPPTC